jgi:hypothetical protein
LHSLKGKNKRQLLAASPAREGQEERSDVSFLKGESGCVIDIDIVIPSTRQGTLQVSHGRFPAHRDC